MRRSASKFPFHTFRGAARSLQTKKQRRAETSRFSARGGLRKYLTIISLSFMDRISMRGDVLLEVLAGGAHFLLALLLWRAVFGANHTVAGYTLPQMASYYLFASFLQVLDRSDGYVWEFASEIREGKFGKYLLRPGKPLGFFLSVCAGRTLFQSLVIIAGALIWALPFAGRLIPPDPLGIALSLPLIFLGLLALALINYLTAILAFVVPDLVPYHMVKGVLAEFLSGTMIPLAVMPEWAAKAIRLTPFPALIGLPADLWLGRGFDLIPEAILVLCAWITGLLLLCERAFSALSERYEEAGA
jgi:ABC-2 type transport system permease protein